MGGASSHGRWRSDASRLQRRNRLDLRVCNWGDPLRIGSTAILHFEGVLYYAMGYPNDEALNAHPLYAIGLGFYSFHVVENSPLIADLDRRNQVHERDVAGAYMKRFRHWIITFHDETLEVVAEKCSLHAQQREVPRTGGSGASLEDSRWRKIPITRNIKTRPVTPVVRRRSRKALVS